MIRRASMTDVDGAKGDVYLYEFYGKSTDTKPTQNVATGSMFVEVDTGKVYLYDEESTTWIEFGGSSSEVVDEDPGSLEPDPNDK